MSIRFSCSCGRKLKVSDEKIGTKVLCPSCGTTLKVPKKSQDEYWQDVPVKSDEAKIDYAGFFKDLLLQIVPGAVVLVGLAYFAYFLSSQIIVGRGNLPPLGKVSGKVTLDGKPVPNAMVRFVPISDDGHERKGATVSMGITDNSGQYTMYYVKDTPGVAVGLCRVEIQATNESGRELLPPDYNSRTTQQRTVKSGSNTFDFEATTAGGATAAVPGK